MPRVRPGHATRRRRNRVLKDARGFRGARSKLYVSAKETLIRGGVYAFRDRRVKKRHYRALWITRVTAAVEARGLSYSRFINGLKRAGIFLNRKMLSEVAIADPAAFDKIADAAKAQLAAPAHA